MKYRSALLLAGEDVTTAGTKVIDIDVQSPISHIDIKWKITKSLDYMTAGAPADLTKIELVDGAKVLWSANGYLAQALGYYNRPGRVLEHGQVLAANSQETHYPIDFGRHLWDKELAFDPRKFVNPQLRITHNESLSDTSATENELEVMADIFDEQVISPIGFLAAMLHHDYTCGGSDSYEPIALPDDRVIRQMLVRAFTSGYEPWYTIDEARLDENTLDNIIFDFTNLENYYRMMKSVWHPIEILGVWNISTGERAFYVCPTDYWTTVLATGHGTAGSLVVTMDDLRGGLIGAVSNTASQNYSIRAMGYLPWHCYQFPFGKQDDLDDWYDPAGKKPRLRLRTGTTGGIGQILLEELIRY